MLVRCVYASRARAPVAHGPVRGHPRPVAQEQRRALASRACCALRKTPSSGAEGGRRRSVSSCSTPSGVTAVTMASPSRFRGDPTAPVRQLTMGHINLEMVNPALLLRYSEKAELNPFKVPAAPRWRSGRACEVPARSSPVREPAMRTPRDQPSGISDGLRRRRRSGLRARHARLPQHARQKRRGGHDRLFRHGGRWALSSASESHF